MEPRLFENIPPSLKQLSKTPQLLTLISTSMLDFVLFEGSLQGSRVEFEVHVLVCGTQTLNELLLSE